jgi:hypothetical protein
LPVSHHPGSREQEQRWQHAHNDDQRDQNPALPSQPLYDHNSGNIIEPRCNEQAIASSTIEKNEENNRKKYFVLTNCHKHVLHSDTLAGAVMGKRQAFGTLPRCHTSTVVGDLQEPFHVLSQVCM